MRVMFINFISTSTRFINDFFLYLKKNNDSYDSYKLWIEKKVCERSFNMKEKKLIKGDKYK